MLTNRRKRMIIEDEKMYYIGHKTEIEHEVFDVPVYLGICRRRLKCVHGEPCGAKAWITHNEVTDTYYNFQMDVAHDEEECPWNLVAICKEFYKEQLYKEIRNGTFEAVGLAYNWAVEQFSRFYPAAVFYPVRHFKSKGNALLKAMYPRQPTLALLPDVEVPEELTLTLRETPFLLFKMSYLEDGRTETIIVFGSAERFRDLCVSKDAYSDGTFKICPDPFYQVYIIHAPCMNVMKPCLYCLLTRKTERTYRELFNRLRLMAYVRGHPIQWERFRCDYEIGVMNAVSNVFVYIIVIGCFFHFCSALFKKAMELGHAVAYHDPNSPCKPAIKKCMGLAHLPPALIAPTFALIRDDYNALALPRPDLNPFFDYVEHNWVMGAVATVHRWSVAALDHHRTTNDLEGYHSHLKRAMGPTSNLWKFIQKLRAEENRVFNDVQRLVAGEVPIRKRKYESLDERLKQCKTALNANPPGLDPLQFVTAVSHTTPH